MTRCRVTKCVPMCRIDSLILVVNTNIHHTMLQGVGLDLCNVLPVVIYGSRDLKVSLCIVAHLL